MIPHDLIGSRPMELDTAQRRRERDLEIVACFVAVAILAELAWWGYWLLRALWGWL